jgi:hypothetical protein
MRKEKISRTQLIGLDPRYYTGNRTLIKGLGVISPDSGYIELKGTTRC